MCFQGKYKHDNIWKKVPHLLWRFLDTLTITIRNWTHYIYYGNTLTRLFIFLIIRIINFITGLISVFGKFWLISLRKHIFKCKLIGYFKRFFYTIDFYTLFFISFEFSFRTWPNLVTSFWSSTQLFSRWLMVDYKSIPPQLTHLLLLRSTFHTIN